MAKETPWLKRVLIPFWIIQLGLLVIICGATIWLATLGFTVTEALLIIYCFACIGVDVTEIILFARGQLKPLAFLIFQLVKAPGWCVIFLYAAVGGAMRQRGSYRQYGASTTLGVIIFAVLFFAFLGTLIYGSIIFHRHRRNKRKALRNSNITTNPYYNGPYSENGITTANYEPLNSPYPLQSDAGDTIYTEDSGLATMPAAQHYTANIQDKDRKRAGSAVGNKPTMLAEMNSNDDARELPATQEVYELASAKSVKR